MTHCGTGLRGTSLSPSQTGGPDQCALTTLRGDITGPMLAIECVLFLTVKLILK